MKRCMSRIARSNIHRKKECADKSGDIGNETDDPCSVENKASVIGSRHRRAQRTAEGKCPLFKPVSKIDSSRSVIVLRATSHVSNASVHITARKTVACSTRGNHGNSVRVNRTRESCAHVSTDTEDESEEEDADEAEDEDDKSSINTRKVCCWKDGEEREKT